MKRVVLAPFACAFVLALASPATALADDPYGLASSKPSATSATSAERGVARSHDMGQRSWERVRRRHQRLP